MAAKKTVARERMTLAGGKGYYDGEVWDAPVFFGGPYGPATLAPLPHGTGTMQYDDDSVYTGQWRDGDYWGRGRLTTTQGEYDGDWVRGKRQGQGKQVSPKAGTYEGWWEDDQRSGDGVITWRNGAVLRGKWEKDKPTGECTINWPGEANYTGQVNGKGYPEGQGTKTWASGCRYEGNWANGERDGNGTYYDFDGGTKAVGTWVNGKRNGDFTITDMDTYRTERRKYSKDLRTD